MMFTCWIQLLMSLTAPVVNEVALVTFSKRPVLVVDEAVERFCTSD